MDADPGGVANLYGLWDWVGMAPGMGPMSPVRACLFPLGRPVSRKAGKNIPLMGNFFDFNSTSSSQVYSGFLSHSDRILASPILLGSMRPCNLESFFFIISIMKNLTDPHLLGYVHIISESFSTSTKTRPDRASVHT